jgi:hypothetical protein
MPVRIYQPAKTAMQSGRANTRQWILEFEPAERRELDPLMGWTSSGDTSRQLQLKFDSREEAVAYARQRGLAYVLIEPPERKFKPKSYADNFRYDRIGRWTH